MNCAFKGVHCNSNSVFDMLSGFDDCQVKRRLTTQRQSGPSYHWYQTTLTLSMTNHRAANSNCRASVLFVLQRSEASTTNLQQVQTHRFCQATTTIKPRPVMKVPWLQLLRSGVLEEVSILPDLLNICSHRLHNIFNSRC